MKILAGFVLLVLSSALAAAAEATSGPILQISPKPISFPRTTVGAQGYAAVTLTNIGTADLTITKLATYGYQLGNFGISADGCTGFTAAPGESCDLELQFDPGRYGLFITWLLVFDNESVSPQHVLLEGCGYSQGIGCQKQ